MIGIAVIALRASDLRTEIRAARQHGPTDLEGERSTVEDRGILTSRARRWLSECLDYEKSHIYLNVIN